MNVPNQFIEMKSINKLGTGKVTAHKLCVFFNYLHEKHSKDYQNATNNNVLKFIDYLIYGDVTELRIQNPQNSIAHSTLVGYVSSITDFYRWLDQNYGSEMTFYEVDKKVKPQSYLYGQIYNYKHTRIINHILPDTKGSREYIKWYTVEEKSILLRNFLTLRDMAVFMLTLEGFRIDEVLSMQLRDYNGLDRLIQPSRSKRKQSATANQTNRLRTIRISEETATILNQYLFEERTFAENKSLEVSDDIFINLRGATIGKPLEYHNYLRILKKCAKRSGLDSKKIRTHSGRSTKVMEILEDNALNPEDTKSDIEIMRYFGWLSMESITSYMNYNSEILANAAYKRTVGAKDD
ncbi:site-specific integrase [Bengtsoniella intestinalis]|uniref:tyrosine-type recombinase/integrase n=1 Tax=Bengtsoniella intestinalis TaxID=3073143 RepID=UPI00391F8078